MFGRKSSPTEKYLEIYWGSEEVDNPELTLEEGDEIQILDKSCNVIKTATIRLIGGRLLPSLLEAIDGEKYFSLVEDDDTFFEMYFVNSISTIIEY